MPPLVRIDPKSAVPIWAQIEEGVRALITSGTLAPRAAVPSVRELAHELLVNPATVAKAYQRLADAGVLTVRRGEGTFVADRPPSLPAAERRRALHEAADRYAHTAVALGVDPEDAVGALRAALAELLPVQAVVQVGKRR
jgi:GntR family transcriptional regulator